MFISVPCRVTLVVAFGFLPQNFGTKNGTLLFYECRLSVGDTQRWWGHLNPSCCNQIRLNILHSNGWDTKHLPCTHSCPRARLHRIRQVREPPCETFTTFFHCWYRLKFNVYVNNECYDTVTVNRPSTSTIFFNYNIMQLLLRSQNVLLETQH